MIPLPCLFDVVVYFAARLLFIDRCSLLLGQLHFLFLILQFLLDLSPNWLNSLFCASSTGLLSHVCCLNLHHGCFCCCSPYSPCRGTVSSAAFSDRKSRRKTQNLVSSAFCLFPSLVAFRNCQQCCSLLFVPIGSSCLC